MILLVFHAIYIVSPDSISEPYMDITIVFEPPLTRPNATVVLDGKRIHGELGQDYFYHEPAKPLAPGQHTLLVVCAEETVKFVFHVKGEIQTRKRWSLNYLNIGGGGEFNSSPETLAFTTYPRGRYALVSGDIDMDIGNLHITGTYLKDPEYPLGWYGALNLEATFMNINAGSINPLYSELTMYSPYGAGVEISWLYKKSALNLVYMKSSAYDTLISEFQRTFLCLNATIESTLTFTVLKGKDDTASFTGLPIELPMSGIIYAGRININIRGITFYGEISHSRGVFNMYLPSSTIGNGVETGVKWRGISLCYRKIDSLYIPIGNPYIDKDRRVILEGTVEKGIFTFQSTNYAILNRPFSMDGLNLSLYSTIGINHGVNLGIQFGNTEGYNTFTGNFGGFFHRSRASLSGVVSMSYIEGYGRSGSFTGNLYVNLVPILVNTSLAYTWGTEQETSLSLSPEFHTGRFQFSFEYRTIIARDYRETSLKALVKLLYFQTKP